MNALSLQRHVDSREQFQVWPSIARKWGAVHITIPSWTFFVIFVVSTFAIWRRDQSRSSTSLCHKCKYDLTSNTSGRRPECGTAIDPKQLERIRGVDSVSTNPTDQKTGNQKLETGKPPKT